MRQSIIVIIILVLAAGAQDAASGEGEKKDYGVTTSLGYSY
jgi:hypothetical protein